MADARSDGREGLKTKGNLMISSSKLGLAAFSILALAFTPGTAGAKDKVKVGFIGPLTGGVSVNGIGGRNSADLAVKLRNTDQKAKYEYELVVLDDECKPNVAVQVATKMAADCRRLSQVRISGDRMGCGSTRHHLPQQISGSSSRQRHDDQPK